MNYTDLAAARFGDDIVIYDGASATAVRGFAFSMDIKNDELHRKATPIGFSNDEKFLLIVPERALKDGEPGKTVRVGFAEFELLYAEYVPNGAISHWEGVMRLKGGCGNA